MKRLYRISDSVDMNLSKLWEITEDREAWGATVHGVANNLNMECVCTWENIALYKRCIVNGKVQGLK